ncbi:hypothetical protein AB0N87_00275 [Streptomyces sp. NPDC093228]|uniref:hypothetical protein n=1 Tax=unclassified Streptomyces TaxID=2593676 RepID=UPI000E27E2EC|nr:MULTISPECIES: hypothetical protein [unclassified Streptomyces]MDX3264553.1 hypothetical protein [Streptomyces sp. MI02-2A]REE61809.1 hypothetical protein BX257_4396 [Streptomyces sp. 3212.3]
MTEQQTTDHPAVPEGSPSAAATPQPAAPPVPEGTSPEAGVPGAFVVAGPPPAKKDRRVLRAALRWTAAVAVFAAVGAGTAFGITSMDRTEVPGLATEADGRWTFPEIVRPPLPSGSPRPFTEANAAGTHYADLRALVLPAPAGAREDKALHGKDGWLPTEDFLAEYSDKQDRKEFGQRLTDHGLRHIAGRGWTTQDGTHTRIYLLHFDTATVVDDLASNEFASFNSLEYAVRDAHDSVMDSAFPSGARISDISHAIYVEPKPYGAQQVRQAYLRAGDVFAVIIQSRKGTASSVPFQQTVTLQSELLD